MPSQRCETNQWSCGALAAGYGLLAICLAVVASRVKLSAAEATADFQTAGVANKIAVFQPQLVERLTFPLSWTSGKFTDFTAWRETARRHVFSCLLNPPATAPWNSTIIGEEDRGRYVARKVVFNLTADSRVLGYMTVPKGPGPFPAVLLLHDHGGKFDIGKEKVVRPWGIAAEKASSAEKWVGQYYGGRYLADTLAEKGYICFVTDMLNWSDRGGGDKDAQWQINSNLLHVGMSFAGLIAWEDLRAAEFLAQFPGVDPKRIAAMGLSVGAQRTWQIAALSPHIAAGVSICWMTTVQSVMTPPNNQTRTSSAYSNTHPGLLDDLDYPDVASIACPKPLLVHNGRRDGLFPVPGVEAAYARMRAVWASQQAGEKLVTKLWDVAHVFNAEMQDEAFAWLDRVLPGPQPNAESSSAGPKSSLSP